MSDKKTSDEQKSRLDFLKMETEGMRRLGHAAGITMVLAAMVFVSGEASSVGHWLGGVLLLGTYGYVAAWGAIRLVDWVKEGFSS
jgi:hypothetical protein